MLLHRYTTFYTSEPEPERSTIMGKQDAPRVQRQQTKDLEHHLLALTDEVVQKKSSSLHKATYYKTLGYILRVFYDRSSPGLATSHSQSMSTELNKLIIQSDEHSHHHNHNYVIHSYGTPYHPLTSYTTSSSSSAP